MRIVGVDLASRDDRTGLAVLVAEAGSVRVQRAVQGASDDDVLGAVEGRPFEGGEPVAVGDQGAPGPAGTGERAAAVGIDAPFGWPVAFTDALGAWAEGGSWTVGYDAGDTLDLRMRVTDRVARSVTGRWPLSVSTDRIALPAMRGAHLLTRIARARHQRPLDRTGLGGVYETWPVGSLRCWALHEQGYNADAPRGEALRTSLLEAMGRLEVGEMSRRILVEHPDAFDALLAALTALAAAQGRTQRPTPQQVGPARLEGWIHLPSGTTLDEVLRRGAPDAPADRPS